MTAQPKHGYDGEPPLPMAMKAVIAALSGMAAETTILKGSEVTVGDMAIIVLAGAGTDVEREYLRRLEDLEGHFERKAS